MILDADLVFSNKQAVTATAASTNKIDLGVAGDAIGQELTIHAVVDTAFATLTSLTVSLETSADDSTWTTVLSGPAIARASLTKGASIFCVRVPQGLSRYVRLKYTVGGSNATAGKVTAFASKDL
mgnify:CR=1 FL=1